MMKARYVGNRHYQFESCEESNVCFREHIDLFKKPPFCPSDLTLPEFSTLSSRQITNKCGEVSLKSLYQFCMTQAKILAMKVNRIEALEQLESVVDNIPNTKVIYRGFCKNVTKKVEKWREMTENDQKLQKMT